MQLIAVCAVSVPRANFDHITTDFTRHGVTRYRGVSQAAVGFGAFSAYFDGSLQLLNQVGAARLSNMTDQRKCNIKSLELLDHCSWNSSLKVSSCNFQAIKMDPSFN